MKKIERPDWGEIQSWTVSSVKLDYWFDTNIEPLNALIEGSIKVVGEYSDSFCSFTETYVDPTHQAYLIDIKPVKKEETKDEFIKWVIEVTETDRATPLGEVMNQRAKAALEIE